MSESELDAMDLRMRSEAKRWPPSPLDKMLTEAADAITTLRAELKKEREDAERYRWLRSPNKVAGVGAWQARSFSDTWTHWGNNEELDAAIDAARSAS